MRIYVIVATKGRPREVARLIACLAAQTTPPAGVIVIGTSSVDVNGVNPGDFEAGWLTVETVARPGLTRQRNAGIDRLLENGEIAPGGDALVIFFDDDFRPAVDWLEQAAVALTARPDAIALGGALLLNENDTSEERAVELIEQDMAARRLNPTVSVQDGDGLYGCNMAVRGAVLLETRFDEGLPLYSWLEDADFSIRLKRRGVIIYSSGCRGVHLNTVGGRISGTRFGYSQVANPVYLTRRGSMNASVTLKLVSLALVANLYRSFRRRPGVDHPGRLRGNMRALWDIARRCDAPDRILQLPG